tara:strand:+ start:504 stop:755 length:252 start_codon:yes stop_codon:yes gene_type:complete
MVVLEVVLEPLEESLGLDLLMVVLVEVEEEVLEFLGAPLGVDFLMVVLVEVLMEPPLREELLEEDFLVGKEEVGELVLTEILG